MGAVIELEISAGEPSRARPVRVLRATGSEGGRGAFDLDVDALVARLSSVEATVLASAVPARRTLSAGEGEVRRIGAELFDRLFTGDVGAAFRTSRALAHARGENLQLRLRLEDPALAALPWEAMFDGATGTYLCRKESLIRQIGPPESLAPLRVDPPLRILGLLSSPRNLATLDVEAERDRLERALAPHVAAGLARIEWIEQVSWDRLHGRLLAQAWHVLHFVGHSRYQDETDEGELAFCGPDGRAEYVGAAALADLLDETEPTPRLVVLNSCMSGASGLRELYSGTAAALVRSGISAVVAMQFTVSDAAALAFAHGFYAALAYGRTIDDATRSGRIAILGLSRDTLEWITPVLYLRGEDTRLFTVAEIQSLAGRHAGAPDPLPPAPADAEAVAGGTPLGESVPPGPRRRRRTAALVGAGIGLAAIAAAGIALAAVLPGHREPDASPAPGAGTPSPVPTTTSFAIPASQLWTVTAVECAVDEPLQIRATGIVQHGGTADRASGPDGMDGERLDTNVVDDANHAALIGRVGESGAPFLVGSALDMTCPADGALFLGINDEGYVGNVGDFDVTVTHEQ
ncbi:CHAT domain-containing protein [Microbacterium jiangjiandongii]|uniref:CHAT domain-containing protein n=1 Tax=Microbacterium jiangjiandongii TaxID=3049071 RepID=UPI00214C14A4|nr:CHAT domain-containing protein [Microbacterium sp. zg.Y843]MCR2814673.1 CHAT domain-containing protein [Microbacterium sp. zg.Y843]